MPGPFWSISAASFPCQILGLGPLKKAEMSQRCPHFAWTDVTHRGHPRDFKGEPDAVALSRCMVHYFVHCGPVGGSLHWHLWEMTCFRILAPGRRATSASRSLLGRRRRLLCRHCKVSVGRRDTCSPSARILDKCRVFVPGACGIALVIWALFQR